MLNKNFYPTPTNLITKMWDKVQDKENIKYILEPSAGKGDIIEYINKNKGYYDKKIVKAIEKDNDLFATLLGKEIPVIDRDFLAYQGGDVFDLIIMNPPFDNGDKHLLKAIDLMYNGQIVCLLNAETLKNPYSAIRKELAERLQALNADIQYLHGEFKNAQRTTNVEVALIYINIEGDIGGDLLGDANDTINDKTPEFDGIDEQANITKKNDIEALEIEYKQKKEACLDVIKDFYRNFKKTGDFIQLIACGEKSPDIYEFNKLDNKEIFKKICEQVNSVNKKLRSHYWNEALMLPTVRNKMTSANEQKFRTELHQHANLEFTANNVRQFIINLIGNYEQTLIDAAIQLFDDLTTKHSWHSECDKNKLHFSTWKTNTAFKVSKKIIIPCHPSYGGRDGSFYSYDKWKLDYQVANMLNDIDKVLNYIAGKSNYIGIVQAIETSMEYMNMGAKPQKNESEFFTKIKYHKKGTIHLTFKDENILRKFNIIACKGKGWLPHDYGYKAYEQYTIADKAIVDSFEGEKKYKNNMKNTPNFSQNNSKTLMIEEVKNDNNHG